MLSWSAAAKITGRVRAGGNFWLADTGRSIYDTDTGKQLGVMRVRRKGKVPPRVTADTRPLLSGYI